MIYEDNLTKSKRVSFIYALGKQIAKIEGEIGSSAEKLYYHHDNLGSSRLMTDGNGKVKWEQDYLPFGEDLSKPDTPIDGFGTSPEYKFTGQRQVEGIGLYYYGARFYDPALGRFITEDTYPGEMIDPQTQNLYIYTINNPLKYIDPTGHYIVHNVDQNVLDIIIEEGDDLGGIVQEIYKSKHMLKHVMALNNLESLEDLDIGDHLLLPISFVVVAENDLFIVDLPTLEIAGELWNKGKIDVSEYYAIKVAIEKPSYDDPQIGYAIPGKKLFDWLSRNAGPLLLYTAGTAVEVAGWVADLGTITLLFGSVPSGGSSLALAPVTVFISSTAKVTGAAMMGTALYMMRQNSGGGKKKPIQEHHFASNKSKKYTPQIEELTKKYKLDLNDPWNKEMLPHQGRHPNAYHDYILENLKQFDKIAQGDQSKFLKLFDQLKREIINNPEMLYKNYWRGR